MTTLNDSLIKNESLTPYKPGKGIEMFFRNPGEKYGFAISYNETRGGIAIGLDYVWPEWNESTDRDYLRSSMITGSQFIRLNFDSHRPHTEHAVLVLMFKHRDNFYINVVIIRPETKETIKAELMCFETEETMLAFAKQQYWLGFGYEVERFLSKEGRKMSDQAAKITLPRKAPLFNKELSLRDNEVILIEFLNDISKWIAEPYKGAYNYLYAKYETYADESLIDAYSIERHERNFNHAMEEIMNTYILENPKND